MRIVIHIRWPNEGKLSSQQRATLNGVLGRDNYDVIPIKIKDINALAKDSKLSTDFDSLFTNGYSPDDAIAVIFTARELSAYELKVFQVLVHPRLGGSASAAVKTLKWQRPTDWLPVII